MSPWVPCGLALAMLIAFAVDLPVARLAKGASHPRWFAELLEITEAFGHGIGATIIVIATVVLDPVRRRQIWQLLASSLGAGFVANGLKLILIRTRPRDVSDWPEVVWRTFGGLWSASGGNAAQSFPSAHSATAAGLATALCIFYPHGRWLFATLAMLVGFQRIVVSAHYPSDVFAGMLVGWITANICASAFRTRR